MIARMGKTIALVSLIIMTAMMYQGAFAAEEEPEAYSSDNIIIVYEDGTTAKEKKEVLKENDLQKIETVSEEANAVLAGTGENVSVEEAISEAEKSENVAYAQPDFRYDLLQTTNDPGLPDQLHLSHTMISDSYTSAWDYSTGRGVNICIMDSCLNTEHKEIKAHLKGTYNAVTGTSDVKADDDAPARVRDHGMHVTGIAAAVGNNAYMGAGVAYDVNIYFAKVYDDGISTSNIIKAYDWALKNDCRVVNMSFGGGYDYSENGDRVLSERIRSAYNRSEGSVLTVCSGGNDGTDTPTYPSDFPESYSVTAVGYPDGAAEYWRGSNHNEYKDIAAPGVDINSLGYTDDGVLLSNTGTSMAAPFVTGTAALMLSIDPGLTAKELAGIMNETALSLTGTDEADGYGHGLVDPFAAVRKVTYRVKGLGSSYAPLAGEKLSFTAVSNRNGSNLYFEILDSSGNTVKTLGEAALDKGSSKAFSWDYRNESGDLVPSGKYTLRGNIDTDLGFDEYTKSFNVSIAGKPQLTGFAVTGKIQRNNFNTAKIAYSLGNKTLTTTTITDSKGSVVRSYKATRTGSITQKWDLRNGSGKLVPAGTYTVKVEGVNIWGKEAPAQAQGTIKITKPGKVKFASFKYTKTKKRKKGNKISLKFRLTQDARVTVKVYRVKTGKLVKVAANGKVLRKGKRYVRWDLKNKAGRLVPRGKYRIKISAKNSVGKTSRTIKVRVK